MYTFYKNQIDFTNALKDLIDSYGRLEIGRKTLHKDLRKLITNNKRLMYKDGDYTSTVKQRLGIKRLLLVAIVLGENE